MISGRLFPQIFWSEIAFENCLVEISLQRGVGRNVSSNTFLVEVCAGISWRRFPFREILVEKSSSKRFWQKCVQRFFGRDSSSNLLAGNVSLECFW